MLQKLRMLQIRDVKSEAVHEYCEPLTTKEMRRHTGIPPEARSLIF
jgi:hypothetical protein